MFAVQIFITIFGWATIIFFGKIPGNKSIYISIIALISMFWVILLIGIPFPLVTQIVLGYIPAVVRTNIVVIRIINGIGVFILPLIVGGIGLFLDTQAKRKGIHVYKQFMMGYYYTLGFGVAMLVMILFAPIITIKRIIKRYSVSHTPIMIQEGRYRLVLDKIKDQLEKDEIHVEVRSIGLLYKIPMTILNNIADKLLDTFVSDGHKMLAGEDLEVYIYPTDIMIVGKEEIMQKARAIIATTLTFDSTYMTWSKESQQLEDQGYAVFQEFQTQERSCQYYEERVKKILANLNGAALAYDEWQVIVRQLYMIENHILYCEISKQEKLK